MACQRIKNDIEENYIHVKEFIEDDIHAEEDSIPSLRDFQGDLPNGSLYMTCQRIKSEIKKN